MPCGRAGPALRCFPPDMSLVPGLIGSAEVVVSGEHLASTLGSGSVEVFGTPAMIALMEAAACSCVQDALAGSGMTTVGSRVDIRHLAPTSVGVHVRADAELIEVDGRRLVFHVTASDGADTIGEGTHE